MSKLNSTLVVRLDESTTTKLDKRVKREKTTRSKWVRDLINNALTTTRKTK